MKLFLIGDTHGDFAWMQSKVIKHAKRVEADAVVQLGDFGFIWRQDRPEVERYLNNLSGRFEEAGIPLYWLDGNHENFERMAELGIDIAGDDFTEVQSHITYLPRGFRWEWDGVGFMSLGGAFSIDKSHRTAYVSWWPEERITYADVDRALENGKAGVDVMFTHDAPHYPELFTFLNSFSLPYKLEEESMANRRCLDGVVDELKPRLLVHGHYHHRLSGSRDDTTILGLNHSKTGAEAWALLDTEKLDEQIAELRGK